MIPKSSQQNMEEKKVADKTYRLHPGTGRVEGWLEGEESLYQALWKILQTEKYEHLIYSSDYGIAWAGLEGQSDDIWQAELQRRIAQGMEQDLRVDEVTNVEVSRRGDEVEILVEVKQKNGEMLTMKEGWNFV